MPDLTTLPARTCSSNLDWSTRVKSSKGDGSYAIRWGRVYSSPAVQYDWSCSCPAFEHSCGKACKHIIDVIASGARCGWNSELEPTTGDGDRCPECGGETEVVMVDV